MCEVGVNARWVLSLLWAVQSQWPKLSESILILQFFMHATKCTKNQRDTHQLQIFFVKLRPTLVLDELLH